MKPKYCKGWYVPWLCCFCGQRRRCKEKPVEKISYDPKELRKKRGRMLD